MEAATTTAPRPVPRAPERRMPPGMPFPRPVQTALWSRQARRVLYACQDRYGDMFTIRIAYEGTWVVLAPCVYLTHRNPEVYPEPERFLPERFLDNPPGTYTWIPFGGGVRRCLGAAFAQFEMAVVLRELLRRHRIRPAKPRSERVFRRAITETPRHDAEVILG